MNKSELVSAIALKADVTQKQADAVLTAFVDTVIEVVANGDKVTLVGFGTFEKRDRSARNGAAFCGGIIPPQTCLRNPQTGESLSIPATSVPAFSAGKQFKDAVAQDKPNSIAA